MKVQLVGESCLDVYVYGHCPRLSPEAPVPVFLEKQRVNTPGMVGNVMANLLALGVDIQLHTQVERIVKTRYVEETRNHPLLRVDEDAATILPFDWDLIDSSLPLMVSDYNKGFLREDRLETYKSTPSFIDTKRALGRWAMPYDFIKINQHADEANRSFCEANKTWLAPKLVVTLGHEGALYMGEHFKVRPAQVFDVTGAGDTFFAAFVASYLKHSSAMKAIHFANECARSVVMERGTSVVSPLCAGFM